MGKVKQHGSLLQRLRTLLRRKPKSPEEPYAGRLVPVLRGPTGRSGAAAVEPEDDSFRSFPPRRS